MGLVISRFKKKQTTIEVLEGIDKDISRLQKNRKDNQERQKRIATSLLIYSFILYVLSAIIFFFLYFPDTWLLRLLYSMPLLAFPFLIWGVKKILHWYFVKRIQSNDLALKDLREKKKQILEDVMESETYKKAKEILEKFDPARFKRLESNEATSSSSPLSSSLSAPGLHQRKPTSQPTTPKFTPTSSTGLALVSRPTRAPTPNPYVNTPLRAPVPAVRAPAPSISASGPRLQNVRQPMVMSASNPNSPAQMPRAAMMGQGYAALPGPPMPRSVLPRERGTMDRFMDYLVGDGPENRYALICNICHSHNGMALKEEFEYLSFRCCYCYNFNPARKQRPMAPRLEFFTPGPSGVKPPSEESESDEEDDDESGDEEEKEKGNDNANKGTTASMTTSSSSQKGPPQAQRSSANVGIEKKPEGQSSGVRNVLSGKSVTEASSVCANPKPSPAGGIAGQAQQSTRKQSELPPPIVLPAISSNGSATIGKDIVEPVVPVIDTRVEQIDNRIDDLPFIEEKDSVASEGGSSEFVGSSENTSSDTESATNLSDSVKAVVETHEEKMTGHGLEC